MPFTSISQMVERRTMPASRSTSLIQRALMSSIVLPGVFHGVDRLVYRNRARGRAPCLLEKFAGFGYHW